MQVIRPLLFLALVAIGTVSCQKSGGNSSEASPPDEVMVVHGDPMSLVAGTKMNSVSMLDAAQLRKFEKYLLVSFSFVQSEKKTRTEWEGPAKKSDFGSVEAQYFAERSFKVAEASNGLALRTKSSTLIFQKNSKGKLELKSTSGAVGDSQSGKDFEVIHYSQNLSNGLWSLLVRESGQLTSLTFVPLTGSEKFQTDGSKYNYLYGVGVPAKWTNPETKLVYCHSDEEKFEEISRKSIAEWNKVLKGRHQLNMTTGECPPFSDVNERGIYLIDVYVMSKTKNEVVFGATLPVVNPASSEILDSDIFVMRSEIYQSNDNKRKQGYETEHGKFLLTNVMVHELGHFLGLGHHMQGYSVMSYSYNTIEATTYDKNAVWNLYPVR